MISFFSLSILFFLFVVSGEDTNAFSFSIVNQKEEEYHIAYGKREKEGEDEKKELM